MSDENQLRIRIRTASGVERFEKRFHEAFGREMTPEERRLFRLAGVMLEPPPDEAESQSEEKARAAAAGKDGAKAAS